MPITPAAAPILAVNLIATANLGIKIPDFSLGVTNGVSKWVKQLVVIAPSAGTLGAGQGITPLVVPPPVLNTAFLATFPANGVFGIMTPLFILGLSNGLSAVFAQGLVKTTHATVGAGSGVANFKGGSAVPFIVQGLAEVGQQGDGPTKIARAIGQGLDIVFRSLAVPLVVAGPPNIVPGGGPGIGVVI